MKKKDPKIFIFAERLIFKKHLASIQHKRCTKLSYSIAHFKLTYYDTKNILRMQRLSSHSLQTFCKSFAYNAIHEKLFQILSIESTVYEYLNKKKIMFFSLSISQKVYFNIIKFQNNTFDFIQPVFTIYVKAMVYSFNKDYNYNAKIS